MISYKERRKTVRGKLNQQWEETDSRQNYRIEKQKKCNGWNPFSLPKFPLAQIFSGDHHTALPP